MINELRKFLKNQASRKSQGQCEQTLGSNAPVIAFANFWAEHGEDLMVVAAAKLHKFEMEDSHDSAQGAYYRMGLADMGTFFQDCSLEIERARLKAEGLLPDPDTL